MPLNDRLTGSGFLRGVNCVGGVSADLEAAQLGQVVAELDQIEKDFTELEAIIFLNASLTDRVETTGVLNERTAFDHGGGGVVGRASNINRDIRRDRPFAAYDDPQVNRALYRNGDGRARMRFRMAGT